MASRQNVTMKKTNRKLNHPETKLTSLAAVRLPTQPSAVVLAPAQPKPARIAFEFVQPGASRVCVAGSFNQWKPELAPLTARPGGRWVGELTVPAGRHEYLFVVDGQWLVDPKADETVQNPFGGRNAVLTVSA